MLFVIHALDHEDSLQRRLDNYEAHKAYLMASAIKTVVSGPLVTDDGATMIGSLFIVEADSRDEVVAFNRADPFSKANVWRSVEIHAFSKRVDNR